MQYLCHNHSYIWYDLCLLCELINDIKYICMYMIYKGYIGSGERVPYVAIYAGYGI